MDLYIVAMAFAVFIFAVSFTIALGMFIDGWAEEKIKHMWVSCIFASLAIGSFYAYSGLEAYLVWESINAVSENRRHQNPFVSSILLLIPGWCLVWPFGVYPGIARDLNEEIMSLGKSTIKTLEGNAVLHCIMNFFMFLLCIILPFWRIDPGSIIFLAIMIICAIGLHLKVLLGFSKAVSIIKINDEV